MKEVVKGTITKVEGPRLSIHRSNRGEAKDYQRICFHLSTGRSAITYLDRTNHNYKYWKDKLIVGLILNNLFLKRPGLIDADSRPSVAGMTDELREERLRKAQLNLFDMEKKKK